MADWFDHKARWRARWQCWRAAVHARWESWQARRRAACERRRVRMEAVNEALVHTALAKEVLAQSSEELREALLKELWERHHEELTERALEVVRAEQQEHLTAVEEALRDRYAKALKQHEQDLDRQADVREEQMRQELEQEYGDRIGRLRHTRDTWKRRAEQAEQQLGGLWTQLLSEDRRRYLFDSHIQQLDVAALNAILARYGYAVRSAARPSERRVQVRLSSGQVVDRHIFWLETVPVGSMPKDEEDEDEDADPEA